MHCAIAPCCIPVSVLLTPGVESKNTSGCFELRTTVFLEIRKGSFVFCKMNEQTPRKCDCVLCSEVVGSLWIGITKGVACLLVINAAKK